MLNEWCAGIQVSWLTNFHETFDYSIIVKIFIKISVRCVSEDGHEVEKWDGLVAVLDVSIFGMSPSQVDSMLRRLKLFRKLSTR